MNYSAIQHNQTLIFRQPIARNSVRFRLLSARDDIKECNLIFFKRSVPENRKLAPMLKRTEDAQNCEWIVSISDNEELRYIKYYFYLIDNKGNPAYYSEAGFSINEPKSNFFELVQVNPGDLIKLPEKISSNIYYQIFVERFERTLSREKSHKLNDWNEIPTRDNFLGGDLEGITNKLPYLYDLGINCIYLTPIFKADFNHKYATINYYLVDPDFGDLEVLKNLVNKAHELGIRIILDGVFNHVGVHFPYFEDLIVKGEKSKYASWFYCKKFPIRIDNKHYECVGDYQYMPRLNTSNVEVQKYILSVMQYWIKTCNIDGWRLDVADELDKNCISFLRTNLKLEYPNIILLGETWGDASQMLCQNNEMDSVMNYLFRDVMVEYFAHSTINEEQLDSRLQHILMKYPQEYCLGMYNCFSSHDTARFLTESGGELWRLKLAIAFTILFVGCPAIYYGEEIGMMGENDPGCRGGMDWKNPNMEVFNWTKKLISFRKQHEAICTGEYHTLKYDTKNKIFAFERRNSKEKIIAVFNSSEFETDFPALSGNIKVPAHAVKIIIE